MSDPFRIAIVGCGKIAPRHLAAVLASTKTELAALVDPVSERARELGELAGITAKIVTDVQEVLDAVDGVIVTAPNHYHESIAVTCLNEKVPVLIEKPLSTTVDEGDRICQAADSSGTTAAVAYNTRFRENVLTLGSLIKSSYFGTPKRFAYQAGSRGGWSPLSAYNLDRRTSGGGVLVVNGSHFLDRMLDWFGYPVTASLQDDALGGPEANAIAAFEFAWEGGTLPGTTYFSKTFKLPGGFAMECERGIVSLAESANATINFKPFDCADIEMKLVPRGDKRGADDSAGCFLLQLEDFVDACRSESKPMVSAREGLSSMKLIDQLYQNKTEIPFDWSVTVAAGEER